MAAANNILTTDEPVGSTIVIPTGNISPLLVQVADGAASSPQQLLYWGGMSGSPATTSARYTNPAINGAAIVAASPQQAWGPCYPTDRTLELMTIVVGNGIPLITDQIAFFVNINNVDVPASQIILPPGDLVESLAFSIPLPANSRLNVKALQSGTESITNFYLRVQIFGR